ncbi:MAG TPA: hypothetical protein VMT68_17755 [Caulobacteraceae bacterium]|nr:hypothetical protein [Caulobacteraceae bacterium]
MLAALALAACSLPVADKQSDAVARAFYDELRAGADLTRDPHLDPALKPAAAALSPADVRAQIPSGPPTKVNVTGWNYNTSSGEGSNARLSHDYVYAGRTVHVMTGLRKYPGQADWTIVGFRAIADGAAQPILLGTMPPTPNED